MSLFLSFSSLNPQSNIMTDKTKGACFLFYDKKKILYENLYFKEGKFKFSWFMVGFFGMLVQLYSPYMYTFRSIQLQTCSFFFYPQTSGSLLYLVIFIKPHCLSSKWTASSNIIPQVSFCIFSILRYTGASASATYRQHISSLWLTLTNARLNDLSFCAN